MLTDFKAEQLAHAALAQYYRWYQVYEVPFTVKRIENQKDILSDEVEIITHVGTTKGKDGLDERLRVYEGWLNAHHVQHTEIKQVSEKELSLEADIIYQNIRPDQSKYCYAIHYSATLQLRKGALPVFTMLRLSPAGEIKDFIFKSAYAENRSKSFLYYWMYLMETTSENSKLFNELLAADFSLKTSGEKELNTVDAFNGWIQDISANISAGSHTYKNLVILEREEDLFAVSVDFDWTGVNTDNKKMIGETHHEWVLVNNKDERFARLKKITITVIKPFQIVK